MKGSEQIGRALPLMVGLLVLLNLAACNSQGDGTASDTEPASPSVVPSSPEPIASATSAEDQPFEAEIQVDAQPGYVTTGAGSVWVGNHVGGTVSRVDPQTNSVTEAIRINGEPTGMLFAFDDVWTFAALTGRLNRIDADKNAVVARVSLKGNGGGINGLAAGADHIWVAENSGSVYGVDPKTNKVVKTIKVLRACGPGGNLTFVAGAVWYACWDEPFLWRIDPASGTIAARIRVGPMAGSPADGGDVVWVSLMSKGIVVGVDPVSNELTTRIKVGAQVEQVRVRGDDMWARVSDTELAHVSLKKKKVTETFELPSAPIPGGGLALGFGSVWIANFGESTVWRLNQ